MAGTVPGIKRLLVRQAAERKRHASDGWNLGQVRYLEAIALVSCQRKLRWLLNLDKMAFRHYAALNRAQHNSTMDTVLVGLANADVLRLKEMANRYGGNYADQL